MTNKFTVTEIKDAFQSELQKLKAREQKSKFPDLSRFSPVNMMETFSYTLGQAIVVGESYEIAIRELWLAAWFEFVEGL